MPDWRDPEPYAPLLQFGRSAHAWEWLRRDARYRAAAADAGTGISMRGGFDSRAARWALNAFEPFELAADVARPSWRVADHPYVLRGCLTRCENGREAERVATFLHRSTIVHGEQVDYHVFGDGRHPLRIDLDRDRPRDGPLAWTWRIDGLSAAEAPILVLRRLIALLTTGHLSKALAPDDPHRRRLVLALRAHDAVVEGASHRDVAEHLLDAAAGSTGWRISAASARSQAQRLVGLARRMADGGWRTLLQ